MASVFFLRQCQLDGPDNRSIVLGDPEGQPTTKGREHLLPVARRGFKRQRREKGDRCATMNGIDERGAQARQQVLIARRDLTYLDQSESPDGSALRGMAPRRTFRLQRDGLLRASSFLFLQVRTECIQVVVEALK